ncbi:MAG: AAA family ATPase [Alphaproteobacteria bacterium]|nr:AAA family ATPase [Alphaproteobacteria bacterium]
MMGEEQGEVLDMLSRPESHGRGVKDVERVDTHISSVFLAGDRAYKLKRALKLPFLDFSTLEARHFFCNGELAVNRVAAPSLYLGVAPVLRRSDGALAIGDVGDVGNPDAVDWLVVMRRFDQETLFDRMARRGELTPDLMRDLGGAIARFHRAAEVRRDRGGSEAFAAIIEGNRKAFQAFVPSVFTASEVEALTEATLARLRPVAALLDERREAGKTRRCHGDLHLRNICLLDGAPTLFDAIEFSDAFAFIDVVYDVSFLLMDLDSRDLRPLANIVFNAYLSSSGDSWALPALPVFLSVRAAIRSHVAAAMAAAQPADIPASVARRLREEAREDYLRALEFLVPSPPRLLAVGGLSGSGKSRLGRGLAPLLGVAPGALQVRSDAVRKRLLGVDLYQRLEPAAYARDMSRRTYAAMFDELERALSAGHSVIADAVFAAPEERAAVEAMARRLGVPFDGLWLEATYEVASERIASRTHNISDATEDVLKKQMGYDLGEMSWTRIDSSGPREATLEQARRLIGV